MLETIKVQIDDWRVAGPNTILYTVELNVCAGILIYDFVRRGAILGHWCTLKYQDEMQEPLLREFLAQSDKKNLRGYLRGISPWVGEFVEEEAKEKRDQAIGILDQAGVNPDRRDIVWNTHAHEITGMKINTVTGGFVSKVRKSEFLRNQYPALLELVRV